VISQVHIYLLNCEANKLEFGLYINFSFSARLLTDPTVPPCLPYIQLDNRTY